MPPGRHDADPEPSRGGAIRRNGRCRARKGVGGAEGDDLRPLKGRANPRGNPARRRRTCSLDPLGGLEPWRKCHGEPGTIVNRERELGLDRRETG